ncbi:MAG: acyl-CoA thioesterase [Clostridia bacterium]|nr:acyl-CoA thioesterase [Clostridia bacterium]
MKAYRRQVQYYETDMMGITHHSNYIRWMEEARIDFMDQMGFPYKKMEQEGVISPVRAVNCCYKQSTRFGDGIEIMVAVKEFNGVVLTLRYEMKNAESGAVVCTAESEHVFLDRSMRFIRMKRDMPDFYAALMELAEEKK